MTADQQVDYETGQEDGSSRRPPRARRAKAASPTASGNVWLPRQHVDTCDVAATDVTATGPGSTATAALAAIVARDIVPALMTEFAMPPPVPRQRAAARDQRVTKRDRAAFAASVLSVSTAELVEIANDHLEDGVPLERVLLDLLAPTARHLGVLWERDEITFVDVTIAVQKMQQVLHVICASPGIVSAVDAPVAYLAPVPGEVHTFGLVILGELLRRRGWNVRGGLPATGDEIVAAVKSGACTLVGLSLSQETLLKSTTALITRLRRSARGRPLQVIAGGRVFEGRPDLAAKIGADSVFADGAEATVYLDRLTGGRDIVMPT